MPKGCYVFIALSVDLPGCLADLEIVSPRAWGVSVNNHHWSDPSHGLLGPSKTTFCFMVSAQSVPNPFIFSGFSDGTTWDQVRDLGYDRDA